jgi:branched-chain amino acid transport system substrate-binding protein
MTARRDRGRRTRPAVAVPVLLGLVVLGGCGSRVPEAELERANGALSVKRPVLQPASGIASVASGSASPTESVAVSAAAGGAGPTAKASVDRTAGPSAAVASAPVTPGVPRGTADPAAPTRAAGAQRGSAAGSDPAAAPGVAALSKAPIVLGSFGVESGPLGALVAPIPVAARAWAAEVNARGGLAGHPVKVIFADDGGDPQRALAIARRMVDGDKVLAFFATYMVTTLPAVLPYLERERIPMVGSSNGSEAADHSPVVFNPQVGADLGTAWSYVLALTSQSDKRNVAVLYCSEATTCDNQYKGLKEIAPEAGVKIVYAGQMSIAQPDYTAEMLAARNAGADVVTCICDPPTQIRMIRSARRQGWSPLFSATYSMDQEQIKAGKDEVEGLLASATTAPYSTSPKMKPYLDAVARFVPGGSIGGVGAAAWTQGKLLERIASFLDREPPTRSSIFEGLFSLENETLGGLVPPITFPDGDRSRVNLCIVPLRFEQGLFRPLGGNDTNFKCAPGWTPARRN